VKKRPLKPLLVRDSDIETLCLRNDEQKIVVRVCIESHQVADPSLMVFNMLGRFLHIVPLRGYEKQGQRVQKNLCASLAVGKPAGQNLYLLSLQHLGRQTLDIAVQDQTKLAASMPARSALRQLLREQSNVMQVNEVGMLTELDDEFLHDYRIAVRKTRTAIRQFSSLMPADSTGYFGKEFQWLARETNLLRDLDVCLINLNHYRNSVSGDDAHAMAQLLEQARQMRSASFQRMAWHLRSSRYARLKRRWAELLDNATDWPEHKKKNQHGSSEPVTGDVAARQLLKLYRATVNHGRSIGSDASPESLHRLRKQCKRLRYSLDFFSNLFARKALKKIMAELKVMQDALGELQDMHVQRALIEELRLQMKERDRMDEGCKAATIILQTAFQHRQKQATKVVRCAIKQFCSKKRSHQFQRILEQVKL